MPAFKIEITGNHMLLTISHISFVGKIYNKLEEINDDCLFGVDLLKYNNFSIENKGKMDFKIQIVFEAGLIHASENLHQRLEIGRLVFYYREEI